ncbi:hypothetical protein BaRGS_00014253, partial [Batillaria attramentaria]
MTFTHRAGGENLNVSPDDCTFKFDGNDDRSRRQDPKKGVSGPLTQPAGPAPSSEALGRCSGKGASVFVVALRPGGKYPQ